MRVYTKIVYDKDDNIIEEHSYNYNGPVSQANAGKAAAQAKAREKKIRASKRIQSMDDAALSGGEYVYVDAYGNEKTDNLPNAGRKLYSKRWKFDDTSANGDTSYRESTWEPGIGANDPRVKDNLLHKFATYNTIFTLSGLSEAELRDNRYLKQTFSPHDIIARTGGIVDANFSEGKFQHQMDIGGAGPDEHYENPGIGRRIDPRTGDKISKASRKHTESFGTSADILAMGHDIFFENVNILSTVGPNPQRGLANFTKMEFELHEPFGVTLIEKIRAATFTNGYLDYMDAPLLLTIEWKGWDENGNDKILSGHDTSLVRKIPILISRVQFDVDQGGAKYQCIAVPYGDMAFDDRFKFPRCSIDITASTLMARGPKDKSSWIGQIKTALEKQMEDEIEEEVRELPDEYDFVVHPDIIKRGETWYKKLQTINAESNANIFTKARDFIGLNDPNLVVNIDTAAGSIDLKTALPKFFEDAIRTLQGYQELVERFWYTWGSKQLNNVDIDATDKTERKDHRETVLEYLSNKTGQFSADLEKNQYVDWFMIKPKVETPNPDKLDHIRKVSPKKITYYAIPTKIHILKFVKPGISFGNINWDKYVRKNYDYIYTGDNLDVQELKINFQTAYYMRNVRPFQQSKIQSGDWNKFSQKFERDVRKIFGAESYPSPEPRAPLRQEPSHIRGRNTMSSSDPRGYKSQEFYDYLTNPQVDMMKIELKILGDPAYICQDMYTTLGKGNIIDYKGPWSGSFNSFNAEQYQPLIKVNYRLPDESNEKLGVMFEKHLSLREVLFFNGIYQVVKVESSFESGQFTQILHGVRLNNQKGKGTGATFSKGDKTALENKKKRNNKKPTGPFEIGKDLGGAGVSA